jgi:hypothetical protein
MSERAARVVLGVVIGLFLLGALVLDLPAASDRRFWSDGATYYAMASSLAFDFDLRYEVPDLERVRAEYVSGPQGVFLKRGRNGDLFYAKSFVYPAVAAPFVRVLGPSRGLLMTNALCLGLSLVLGYLELRRHAGPLAALAAAVVLFLGTVTPAYFLWFTPELLNLALVTAGLVAWSRDRPMLSAVLLGLAAYSKPTNVVLALPLGLAPLFAKGVGGLHESLRRGGVLAAVVLAGFGVTWAATGEANYQGGERKTFYDRYPFESSDVTFDSAGIWMTTEHLGPLVAGRDEDKQSARVAAPRPPSEIRESFLWNLAYFWTGRFGGALPYFAPAVLAAFLFLLLGPRDLAGGLALGSLALSCLGYLWLIPDNWYGGGGTLGNRYFVNLLPLALFFVPRGRAAWIAIGGAIATAALLLPVLRAPIVHSLEPGKHATAAAFRVFPLELTMLGDLSIFTDVWRKRRPYHAPERRERAAGEPAPYYLWFPDDGTYGQESSFDEEGFWLRGGQGADVVVQALRPPGRIRLRVTAGPAGDIVTVRLGRHRQRIVLNSLRSQEVTFTPEGKGLGYYQTSLFLLRFGSRFGAGSEKDPRPLGSFVRIMLLEGDS